MRLPLPLVASTQRKGRLSIASTATSAAVAIFMRGMRAAACSRVRPDLMRSERRLDESLTSIALPSCRREEPVFDVIYLVLFAALFALSIAMIRYFDRL
jgi:hypothetical protein